MKKFLSLVLILVGSISCNESPDGPLGAPGGTQDHQTETGGTRTPPAQQRSCTEDWKLFVAANPEGRFEKYSVETHTRTGGSISFPGHKSSKIRSVVSSSPEGVAFTVTFERKESTETVLREDFLKNCERGIPGETSPELDVEILEQTIKVVGVPAGAFKCNYIKSKLTPKSRESSADETLSEIYTDSANDYGFLVKSILVQTSKVDEEILTQTTITELVERK